MDSKHYDPRKLTAARERSGRTQQEMADMLNVHRQTICRAEAGKTASYDLLVSLCMAYGIAITDILEPYPATVAA
jgi:DNA-binding XRE family transcriptional regulator